MLQDVWILKPSVSYAEAHSKPTTCATTLPQIINRGELLKLSRETPSLHHWNIYPSNKLFLVSTSSCGWISIFASPLNSNWRILYTLTVLPLQIIWGESSADRMNHSRLSWPAPSRSERVFKPLSQGCVPKVYFYSAVNGYGSKPLYGCNIEWSLVENGDGNYRGRELVSLRPFIPPLLHELIG